MPITLDHNHTLYRTPLFPKYYRHSTKPYKAVIGFGGNIGNMPRRLNRLVNYLSRYPYITIISTSPLLQNPPFGYLDQDDFINGVMLIGTTLTPGQLLRKLLYIERRFGRVRTFKNAPRTLDLDIIFFESKRVYNTTLSIPHPEWNKRESVVIPLLLLPQAKKRGL